MLSEWVEPKWQRPRGIRTVHVIAVLSALLAAGTVFGLFSAYSLGEAHAPGEAERQLVASVDLRIANPAEAFANGEAKARVDVEAGVLQLLNFGKAKPLTKADAAKAQRLKQRHGIVWVHKGDVATLKESAYAAGYNHVVQAEIERRHGTDFLDRLMRGEEPDVAGTP